MVDGRQIDTILASIAAWASSRPDILGLALVGSRARGTARPDSDVDLVLLASRPHEFRRDDHWLAEIDWGDSHVATWRDVDYGSAWSRHVDLPPGGEIELTFCEPAWAATDPVDAGTRKVIAGGCVVLVDKAKLFANLLTAAADQVGKSDNVAL